jgi:hypothetical protein
MMNIFFSFFSSFLLFVYYSNYFSQRMATTTTTTTLALAPIAPPSIATPPLAVAATATTTATKKKVPLLPNIFQDDSTPFVLYRSHRGHYIRQRNCSTNLAGPWPSSTNHWCWHCIHPFDSVPIPIPACWDSNRSMYRIYGNFCSFSCALGWLRDRCFPDVAYQKTLLFHMARNIFQYEMKIFPAPPQSQLNVFGGPLNIVDFRLASKPLESSESGIVRMITREMPFIPYHIAIEEHVQNPNNSNSSAGSGKKKTSKRSEDIQMNGTFTLASGKVPEGGLFQQFLHDKSTTTSATSSTTAATTATTAATTAAAAVAKTNRRIAATTAASVATSTAAVTTANVIQGPITFDSIVQHFASASAGNSDNGNVNAKKRKANPAAAAAKPKKRKIAIAPAPAATTTTTTAAAAPAANVVP